MGVFRFKRFVVANERSAMKVNTDGVLLGVAMTIKPSDRHLLDVGTGTGTIALIAAQRLSEMVAFPKESSDDNICRQHSLDIQAIDIDEASASEAAENFRNSPWDTIIKSTVL